MSNPRTSPCVGPSCAEEVDPAEWLCLLCRISLDLAGHEAQVLSLDDAVKRGDDDLVGELVAQLVGALRVIQRRRGA